MIHGDPELNDIMIRLGGSEQKPLVDMKLRDIVDVLAQNGIRMVYMPEKHMDKILVNDEK